MATGNIWAQPNVDPKRSFRWLLRLGGDLVPTWAITKVSQPNFEISEQEHQFINHKFYYPGRVTWSDVSFTLIDPVQPDAVEKFQTLLRKSGYTFPNDTSDETITDTPSKARSMDAFGNMTLEVYGESNESPGSLGANHPGSLLGSWKLTNAWVKSVTHSELSYESEEFINAEVTVKYDWAEYEASSAGGAVRLRNRVPKAGSRR